MGQFTAYFDASGHKEQHSEVFVSGFVASVGQWKKFDPKWWSLLEKHGIEGEFHMAPFMARKNSPYADWSDERRAEFFEEVVPLIKRHTRRAFSYGVTVAEWEQLHAQYEVPSELDKDLHAFVRCALGVAMDVREWALKNRGERDHFQFAYDRGERDWKEFKRTFRKMFNGKSPVPVQSHEYPGVQAADMLAWLHRKAYEEFRDETERMRPLFVETVRHLPGVSKTRRQSLERLVEMAERKGWPRKEHVQ